MRTTQWAFKYHGVRDPLTELNPIIHHLKIIEESHHGVLHCFATARRANCGNTDSADTEAAQLCRRNLSHRHWNFGLDEIVKE